MSSQYYRIIFTLLPAYQEHYSGVHVEVFEVEAEQADASSKGPFVCEVIINPEGQGKDVGQVGQCQVYHEDHRLGLLAVELTHGRVSQVQSAFEALHVCVCACT